MPSLAKFPAQLKALRLWDGSPVPPGLRRRVLRVYAHYTFLSEQIAAVEVERRTLLQTSADASIDKIRQLMQLKGIGINGAWLLVMELFIPLLDFTPYCASCAVFTVFEQFWGIHLRRDTVIPQWFQASKAAAASDGHAVHC